MNCARHLGAVPQSFRKPGSSLSLSMLHPDSSTPTNFCALLFLARRQLFGLACVYKLYAGPITDYLFCRRQILRPNFRLSARTLIVMSPVLIVAHTHTHGAEKGLDGGSAFNQDSALAGLLRGDAYFRQLRCHILMPPAKYLARF